MPVDDSVRRQLGLLCGRARSRIVGSPRQGKPSDWRPGEVVAPDGQPFTRVGAWEYIAELIDQGQPIREMELEEPKGKTGYVMEVDMGKDAPVLYVKLELGSGIVIGRSFHYSYHDR